MEGMYKLENELNLEVIEFKNRQIELLKYDRKYNKNKAINLEFILEFEGFKN